MNPVDKACPLIKAYISKKKEKGLTVRDKQVNKPKYPKQDVLLKVKQAIGKERMNERLS